MMIAVVGQGYVGLPVALAINKIGHNIIGIDVSNPVVINLNAGRSHIEDVTDFEVQAAVESGRYRATQDYSVVSQCEIIIVCVPTPLSNDRAPDLSFLILAIKEIAKNLREDSLVIIESTIQPGTTRNLIAPMLMHYSGLSEKDFDLAFSPERIDPLNSKWNLLNTPRLVAGHDEKSGKRASAFYSSFIKQVHLCGNTEIAEMAKLLENSFRLINISFVNEVSMICSKLNIDINAVIDAAATKPYGFMPFYPSVGVGGHCIPVDPLYLSNKAEEIGAPTRFIDLADQINQQMPGYFVGRAEEKLGGLRDKKVIVLGVAYKPNVADVRETPVSALIKGLKAKGAQVSWHDELVKEWNDEKSVELKAGFDLAIIATAHTYMDFTKLGDTPILDTRGSI